MDNLEQALPPGAMPKDVADDISAKVSEGEYIIPANVVRYIGASKLEKMVQKALEELKGMEDKGRVGNLEEVEDEGEEEDDVLEFATGGLVPPQDPTQQMAQVGFTGFEQYVGPNGQRINVPTRNGKPLINVPSGYTKNTGGQVKPKENIPSGFKDTDPDKEGPTGMSRAVEDWGVGDYTNMAKQLSTPAGRVANKALGVIGGGLPFGGLISRASDYKMDQAKENLTKMLETGIGPTGVPLSPEERTQLQEAKSLVDNPQEADIGEKVMGGLTKGVTGGKGVFGTAVEVARKVTDNPIDKAIDGLKETINEAIKGAINTTYGEKQKQAEASTEQDGQESEKAGSDGRDSTDDDEEKQQ